MNEFKEQQLKGMQTFIERWEQGAGLPDIAKGPDQQTTTESLLGGRPCNYAEIVDAINSSVSYDIAAEFNLDNDKKGERMFNPELNRADVRACHNCSHYDVDDQNCKVEPTWVSHEPIDHCDGYFSMNKVCVNNITKVENLIECRADACHKAQTNQIFSDIREKGMAVVIIELSSDGDGSSSSPDPTWGEGSSA